MSKERWISEKFPESIGKQEVRSCSVRTAYAKAKSENGRVGEVGNDDTGAGAGALEQFGPWQGTGTGKRWPSSLWSAIGIPNMG